MSIFSVQVFNDSNRFLIYLLELFIVPMQLHAKYFSLWCNLISNNEVFLRSLSLLLYKSSSFFSTKSWIMCHQLARMERKSKEFTFLLTHFRSILHKSQNQQEEKTRFLSTLSALWQVLNMSKRSFKDVCVEGKKQTVKDIQWECKLIHQRKFQTINIFCQCDDGIFFWTNSYIILYNPLKNYMNQFSSQLFLCWHFNLLFKRNCASWDVHISSYYPFSFHLSWNINPTPTLDLPFWRNY